MTHVRRDTGYECQDHVVLLEILACYRPATRLASICEARKAINSAPGSLEMLSIRPTVFPVVFVASLILQQAMRRRNQIESGASRECKMNEISNRGD